MTEATTRLHICPFTPDLLPSIIPASIRPSATDISFHSIPTFPENSYGYITLPIMDADKIKRKLNGSILKGKKFKIEAARPSKRQRSEEDADTETPVKLKKKSKKIKAESKPEEGVIDGYEITSDRKVKRGWTEPNSKKHTKKSKEDKKEKPQPKSKYTEKSECLFRTNIPPNRSDTSDHKKSKKNKSPSESVVHEFAKTASFPSFLRDSSDKSAPTANFEEESGWVDTTGNVKEAVSQKIRKKDYQPGKVPGVKEKAPKLSKFSKSSKKEPTPEPASESEDYTSSSGSSSESSDPDSDSDSETQLSDSAEPSQSEKEKDAKFAKETEPAVVASASESDAKSAGEPTQYTDDQAAKEIHPLEALFKRSAPADSENQPAPEENAGFSFFGTNDDIESEDETTEPQTPFTPFGKKDLQDRGMRSAAPTPDTSAATRHMNWNESDEDMEDEEEEEEIGADTPVSKSRGTDNNEETGFTKWFWENRGENNRSWKRRRRDVGKEQRQRENRKNPGQKGRS
ncbi:hypothetical protein N7495_002936 [Penicillium taxi]|uniref:uncharacterized protein n=1 Tax=Penicillium taxi TaxID=168475 RepID=UPI002544E6C7|nr:uncharacterized protein N7495_002936 [Penicillium taxi]KAJ5902408.1 hypothetical protein N7495_002936 [Penicillium taxi]